MMRRKLLMLILLIASAPNLLQARLPSTWFFDRFRLGVEWGYTQCFFLARNYNFFSEEGYRIHEQFSGMHLASNGSIYGQIGYDLHEKVNLALYVGYIGVGEDNRLLPVQLRASFFPKTTGADGLFTFAQGGPAWHTIAGGYNLGWLAGLGGGYRLTLSEDCNLDLMMGVKYLWDHPRIPNPERAGYVPAHNIRRNDAGYCALDLTIAINF